MNHAPRMYWPSFSVSMELSSLIRRLGRDQAGLCQIPIDRRFLQAIACHQLTYEVPPCPLLLQRVDLGRREALLSAKAHPTRMGRRNPFELPRLPEALVKLGDRSKQMEMQLAAGVLVSSC